MPQTPEAQPEEESFPKREGNPEEQSAVPRRQGGDQVTHDPGNIDVSEGILNNERVSADEAFGEEVSDREDMQAQSKSALSGQGVREKQESELFKELSEDAGAESRESAISLAEWWEDLSEVQKENLRKSPESPLSKNAQSPFEGLKLNGDKRANERAGNSQHVAKKIDERKKQLQALEDKLNDESINHNSEKSADSSEKNTGAEKTSVDQAKEGGAGEVNENSDEYTKTGPVLSTTSQINKADHSQKKPKDSNLEETESDVGPTDASSNVVVEDFHAEPLATDGLELNKITEEMGDRLDKKDVQDLISRASIEGYSPNTIASYIASSDNFKQFYYSSELTARKANKDAKHDWEIVKTDSQGKPTNKVKFKWSDQFLKDKLTTAIAESDYYVKSIMQKRSPAQKDAEKTSIEKEAERLARVIKETESFVIESTGENDHRAVWCYDPQISRGEDNQLVVSFQPFYQRQSFKDNHEELNYEAGDERVSVNLEHLAAHSGDAAEYTASLSDQLDIDIENARLEFFNEPGSPFDPGEIADPVIGPVSSQAGVRVEKVHEQAEESPHESVENNLEREVRLQEGDTVRFESPIGGTGSPQRVEKIEALEGGQFAARLNNDPGRLTLVKHLNVVTGWENLTDKQQGLFKDFQNAQASMFDKLREEIPQQATKAQKENIKKAREEVQDLLRKVRANDEGQADRIEKAYNVTFAVVQKYVVNQKGEVDWADDISNRTKIIEHRDELGAIEDSFTRSLKSDQ